MRLSSNSKRESEGFRRIMEEEAERERFAKEYEERIKREQEEASRPPEPPLARERSKSGRNNPRVFLEIEARGPELLGRPARVEGTGRLEFELYADVVPKTAENFRCLCTGERGKSTHFEGSRFHRIIKDFMAQGGDITDGDGTGGCSIYGRKFADESFARRHDRAGLLSMANSGPNTNNSQFFILFKATPWLDGKHVVFGELVGDMQMLRLMEERGSKSGEVNGTVTITRCGEIRRKRRRSASSSRRDSRSSSRSSSRSASSSSSSSSGSRRRLRHRSSS